MESFGRQNAFDIIEQQHAHCSCKIQKTKRMSQYSTWENIKGILATPCKHVTVTQALLTVHSNIKDISPVS